ncbi:MAG: hypothetical protein V2I79_05360 [Xanthomonadales bacterium]|jgi:hypothetical protein|nr:hypothetical protein [Xanthomonadales bacterium]
MGNTVTIASRFNGPAESGNGGYSCGMLAAFIDGPARVRLHLPPPLDRPLTVRRSASGGVEMLDGQDRVASAVPAALELEPPPAPSLEAAVEAARRYPCYENHIFPTCFVCGPGRPSHDGLELYAGPVDDWSLLACPWKPAPDLLDAGGNVRPEVVWSALDCPGYFACLGREPRPAVLGELHAQLIEAVPGDRDLVVYAWPLGEEGRKRYAGTALALPDGSVLAKARSTWILLRN